MKKDKIDLDKPGWMNELIKDIKKRYKYLPKDIKYQLNTRYGYKSKEK